VRAFQYEGIGIDSLKLVDHPIPNIGPEQVLIRVRAVSLNHKDLLVAEGIPPRNSPAPLIPLSDGAGEVVDVGPAVTRVEVGDRVAAIVAQSWIGGNLTARTMQSVLGTAINGMLSEYIVLNQEGVVRIPEHLEYEQAATLPCAAATAWNSLVRLSRAKPGDTVLVQGSGGVSIFALQFALALGASVIALSGSDEKLRRMRDLGASSGINYRSVAEWDEQVLRLTSNRGADHIVEVGGARTLQRSFRAAAIGGTINFIGVLAGLEGSVDPLPVLLKGLRLLGTSVGPRDVFEEMNHAISQRAMQPVISRVFPFDEAPEAFRYLQSGAHFGKVVIRL
jgi:NADPH:quinone reductase-like Zn-dependent oxidoreductase